MLKAKKVNSYYLWSNKVLVPSYIYWFKNESVTFIWCYFDYNGL